MIIQLSTLVFLGMVRIAPVLEVVTSIVEVVEVLAKIMARLLDFLVGVGVGVSWSLSRIDDVVSP